MLMAGLAFGLAQLPLLADQSSGGASPSSRPCHVNGRVTSGAIALPGVSVTARSGDTIVAVTSTDQDGTYLLSLPFGSAAIHFELTAFGPVDRIVDVDASSCAASVDAALALTPRTAPVAASAAGAPARQGGGARTGGTGPGRAAGAAAQPRFEALSVRESDSAGLATQDMPGATASASSADDPAARLLPPGFSAETTLESVAVSGTAVALDRGVMNERLAALERGEFGLADGQPAAAPGQLGAGGGGRGEGAPGPGGRGGFGGPVIGGRGVAGAGRVQVSATYGLGGSALNAAPFSLRGETPSASDYLQQSFSTTIGGPLKIPHIYDGTRRTTFNFSYSGGRNGDLFDQYATVPDAAFRAGDFSSSATAIIDPLTGQPFPGNRIPTSRLDPSALALLSFIPTPTLPGTTQNYRNTATSHSSNDTFSLRLTHSITAPPVNAGRGRGGGARGGGAGPGGRGAAGRGNVAAPLNVTMNVGVNYRANDGDRLNVFPLLSGTTSGSTLSIPVTVNARYGRSIHVFSATINRTASTTLGNLAFTQDVAGLAGISGVATSPFDWGVPTLTFGSLTSVRDITPSQRVDRSVQLGYTWTRPAGSHTFRAGGTFQQQHNQTQSDSNARGSFTFTGLYTAAGNDVVRGSGQDFADFLLGLPQQATRQYSVSLDNISSPVVIDGRQFGLFFQDDWRWKARWTINYGLQYDVMMPFTEANGHMVNLDAAPDFSAVAPVLAGATGPFSGVFPAGLVNTDWNNVAPRVGVAWRPDTRSVVRFGYGVSYNSGSYANIARQLYQQPPFFLTGTSLGSIASPLTLSDAFAGITPSTVTNTYGIDEHYQLGQIHQWNADYSRDLFKSWVVGATYIGTRGVHLDMLRAPNRGPDGLRIAGVQAFTWQSSQGSSYMNGVSFRVQKRQTKGISGTASYTLSKSRDNTTATGGNATVAQNDQDLDAEWALSNFDRRHQFNGSLSAELPWGKNRLWLANGGWLAALAGDWSMSTNLSWLSGTPLTVRCSTCASDVAQGIGGTLRADYTGQSIALDDPTIDEFFNTAAFAIPAAGTFGNSLRNVVIGPGSHQLNAQFTRDVALGPSRTMSINVNVNNLLNTVILGTVDTNVNSPTFGQVLSVRGMRTARLNIRFRF